MELYTQFKRPKKVFVEKNSGEIRVEKAGYISAEKRIENLMLSGKRLVQSRTDYFDFPDGKEVDLQFNDIPDQRISI